MYYNCDMTDIPVPGPGYSVIYADPAWTYQDKALAGNRGAGCKYDLMTIDQMCDLPVQGLAGPDCLCFMWVTYPMLAEGLRLMDACGFTFKTVAFTWVKRTKHGKLFWGMGRWTRANPELVMLGTRGKPKRVNAGVHSVLEDQIGPHSRKPDSARQRIVSLVGDIPRIELFARGDTPGWDAWGNTPEFK
jgi:N6-adenosine-specific RNA methylase IME4